MNLSSIIYDGKRIDTSQALELFDWDLLKLGKAADFRRHLIKDDEEVGFIIDRIINITNICEAGCRFCAFHARAGHIAAYTLSIDDILAKVQELADRGGSQVMLQGGLHPEWRIEDVIQIVSAVKRSFPNMWLHSFSPAEIVHIGRKSRLSVDETVIALKEAGVDSVPGASDLLVDDIRKQVAPKKLTTEQWRTVMRCLARNGMMSSATMTYGMGETPKQRVEHLEVIRGIQDECGHIIAFIAWSFAPGGTRMSHIRQATSVDYLRMAAISRIYLDNVVFLQAGWLTEGLQTAQLALSMGANDMGGVLTEERVIQATGGAHHTDRNAMIHLIRNAGKTPVLRDSQYRVLKRFHEGTRS